jgi:hypothetical protein
VSAAALRDFGHESGAEATTPSATPSSSASSPPRSPRDGGDAWRPTMTSPIHYSNDFRQLLGE